MLDILVLMSLVASTRTEVDDMPCNRRSALNYTTNDLTAAALKDMLMGKLAEFAIDISRQVAIADELSNSSPRMLPLASSGFYFTRGKQVNESF